MKSEKMKKGSRKRDGVEIFGKKRSSEEEHTKNALASGAEEGRDKLRKAAGRSKYP